MSDDRETHQVALVVMCEAKGVDASDASAVAAMALRRLIHNHRDDDAQHQVGDSTPPACAACGVRPGVSDDATIKRHISCETWSPEEWLADRALDSPDEQFEAPRACEGSGQAPRPHREPVVGHTLANGSPVYARVYDVMDVGMAAGNGYLWMRPTIKSFR